jgi:SAM-dependent methyltransferase
MKFQRKKRRNLLLSLFYKVDKILPLSKSGKLRFYLDLEWIFERLAHEQSFRVFRNREHPVRTISVDFLLRHLRDSDDVLDIGCNCGDLTSLISKKARQITGIDYNASLIAEAREKFKDSGITFIAADAIEYLEKNYHRFDVIILSHILEHLDDPGLLLELCKSRCSHIYLELPDLERTHLNIYRQKVNSSLIYSDSDHIWELDRREAQALLDRHGLVVHDSEFILGVQKYWCSVT